MKVFISVPIEQSNVGFAVERARTMKRKVVRKGHECVTQFEASPGIADCPKHVGDNVAELLRCDALFLLSGWAAYMPCAVCWEVAQLYGKKIFTNINQIPGPKDNEED